MEDEPLLSLRPKNDFERLIWETNKNKQAQVELGKANSRIHELEDKLKTIEKDILDDILPNMKSRTHIQELIIRIRALKEQLEQEKERNKKLTTKNRLAEEKIILLNLEVLQLKKKDDK